MGTWGYGIFDNDTTLDIKADFEEYIEEGLSVYKATERILKEYGAFMEDDEDSADIYLALTKLQMEYGDLQQDIKAFAIDIIENGKGLEVWKESGIEKLEKRKQILNELKAELQKMGSKLHNKIYIIGSVASGKTTLAKDLLHRLSIPWYELDNVVHIRLPEGDKKRTPEEIEFEFNKIITSEKWIIEGVIRPCFDSGFDMADTIILLDTPERKRKYRIMSRWIRQTLKLEKANYKPNLKMLLRMYEWSSRFEKDRVETIKMLEKYVDKVIIEKDVDTILRKLQI